MSSSTSRVMSIPPPHYTTGGGGETYHAAYTPASSPPAPLSPSAFSSPPFGHNMRQFSLPRPPSYSLLGLAPISPSADYSSYLDGLQWPASPLAPITGSPPQQPHLLPSQSATAFSSLAMSVPIPPVRSGGLDAPVHSQVQGNLAALFPSGSSVSSLNSSLPPIAGIGGAGGNVAPMEDVHYQASLSRKRERQYDDTHLPRRPPPPAHGIYVPYEASYERQPQPAYQPTQPHIVAQPAISSYEQPAASTPSPTPVATSHTAQALQPTPPPTDNPIMYRKSSCLLCHRAKTSCDGRRPCDRCIRLDRQHLCVERVRPRGSSGMRKKSTGKKDKKAEAEGDRDEEEDEDGPAVKREQHDEEKEDREGDKDDSMEEQTPREDDKLTASTTSASPLPKVTRTTTISLATPASSSSSSSSSTTSESSSSSFGSDALVGVDERELSSTFLRVMQSDQVSVQSILKQASMRKSIPPMAFQALISYIANSLHPDDFAAFLKSLDASNEDNQKAIEALAVDRLHVRLPDGRLMPRVLFTFRKSSLEALPDSERGVDMAMLYVYRPPPGQTRHATPADVAHAANKSSPSNVANNAATAQSSASAASTSPASASSPQHSTPAGQQSATSHDSNSHDPLSPSSTGRTSSSASVTGSTPAAPSATVAHPASPDTYEPFVPAPVPGANFNSLSEVDLVIQVNREFERLFGYSQREMKDLMMREQSKGLYRLYTPQSLLQLGRWITEACTGLKTEFKAIVTVVNKMKGQTNCVMSARFILDPLGFFSSVCYAYTPLPENAVVK